MRSIKQILIERDGMTPEDAESYIQEAIDELQELLADDNFEEAEDICATYFGLEPDYLM